MNQKEIDTARRFDAAVEWQNSSDLKASYDLEDYVVRRTGLPLPANETPAPASAVAPPVAVPVKPPAVATETTMSTPQESWVSLVEPRARRPYEASA